MNLIKTACLVLCGIVGSTGASALTFTDVNDYTNNGTGPGAYVSTGNSLEDSFSILPGFVPATMDIVSATVTFWMADDSKWDLAEAVVIDLGSWNLLGEFGVVEVAFSTMISSTWINGSVIAALQDGVLEYEVRSVGDLYVKKAQLDATAVGVPDGGSTVALLGLGLISLAAVRRKMVA